MAATPSYPYETRLNILHKPLQLIDEKALADDCKFTWYNQTLCKVNDSVVRLGVVEGEYHWHKHEEDDEFFYVVEGQLLIDLEDRTVELSPRQGFVVPKGVMHRTRALIRTVILMVENAGIIPTGSQGQTFHVPLSDLSCLDSESLQRVVSASPFRSSTPCSRCHET
jgi:hypothetical protein